MAKQKIGNFGLLRKILPGDRKRGIPELWLAEDSGDIYYVKLWQKPNADDTAMGALWNRETRGLMRLQGYPGATELFVRLRDLGASESHYYVVLDGGRRLLLSEMLQNRQRYGWLTNLGEVGRRKVLWEGLLRLAEAISILHDEGTLHRAISPAAIFAGPDGHGDFRLSGFEWSLRVAAREGAAASVSKGKTVGAPELERDEGEYSTGTDWFDFGVTVALLFGVPSHACSKRPKLRDAISQLSSLRQKEKEAILELLEEDPEKRLSNSDNVKLTLRNIVRDLSIVTSGHGRDLVLALRLTSETNLQRIIEQCAKDHISAGDLASMRDWVKRDLRGDVRITARTEPYPHYLLKGERLEYRIRQWNVDNVTTWDVGFCEAVEVAPRVTADEQYFSLGDRKLEVLLYPYVKRNLRTIRDRSAQWDKVLPHSTSKSRLPVHLRDIHDFFRVTQQLDTVLVAAQICPINVLRISRTTTDTTVEITPFEENARNELASYLGLPSPSEQLRDWFKLGVEAVAADDDDDPTKDRYTLLDRRTIASESNAARWRFEFAFASARGPIYRFRAPGTWPVREGRQYLAKNHGGTLTQLRRRHSAIENLKYHEDLLRLIADPRDTSRVSSEALPDIADKLDLDESKLRALKQLWSTQPSFALQGPPGTGKTTLIKAFSECLFSESRAAQILITAHSHHTVDDVRKKLSKLLSSADVGKNPILLRIGAKEPTEHDVEPVADQLLQKLGVSKLVANAPEYLADRVHRCMPSADHGDQEEAELRTFRALVQDSANVTFSTSNAAELAELSERNRRFDWSIIEEAGKAHGFDMAVALQQSHRLWLIGDHKQLPPFNARLFRDLFDNPLTIKKAIQTGAQFAPGLVEPALVDDEDGRADFVERCSQWKSMVKLFASIFEKSIDESGAGPAATLTDQHRMHPDIADIVGRVFYPSSSEGTLLKSPEETHEKFSTEPPYVIEGTSWLPPKRIVWCDVPWVQKDFFAEGETDGLFQSQKEAQAIIDVLKEIRPKGTQTCEIQVLSPYNDQLRAIKEKLDFARRDDALSHMFTEPFNINENNRMGATVDQFQGSEADIVLVSLVRNNALMAKKSVGFLKEANRMNVLLSRARHKLVIVGSWDFFNSRCNDLTSEDDEHYYIGTMMRVLADAQRVGRLSRVSAPQ